MRWIETAALAGMAVVLAGCDPAGAQDEPPAPVVPGPSRTAEEAAPGPVTEHVPEPEPTLRAAEIGPHEIVLLPTVELPRGEDDKPLLVRVTAPAVDGPVPVLVWSHGANGSKDGYLPLARHWATHGYAVLQPTHGDSLSLTTRDERRRFGSLVERTRSRDVGKHWRTRPLDVRAVLDALDTFEKAAAEATGTELTFDRDRIAVGGHSFGAHTTMMVAGMELVVGRLRTSLPDARPKCFLVVSPAGTGKSLDETSWRKLDRPVLFISGSEDRSVVNDDPPEKRREAYTFSPEGDKLLVWIDGAHHGFGGIAGAIRYPTSGPALPLHVEIVQSATTSFLDAHLRGAAAAKAYLAADEMTRATDGAAAVERK